MKLSLVTEQPLWLLVFCILAGTLYAGILYYRNLKLQEFSRNLIIALSVIRFFVIAFLCFLLLDPLIRYISRTVEKPLIILGQDNSSSILSGDSAFYQSEYLKKLQDLKDDLEDEYDVVSYTFGEQVKQSDTITYKEKVSDISHFLEQINTRYYNRNVGAIILCTDGIYNQGVNPLYSKFNINAPIYTIALGDTNVKKDAYIKAIHHNRVGYIGNKFPAEIDLNFIKLKGSSATVTISKGGKTLFTQSVSANSDNSSMSLPFLIEASETGVQRYTVTISHLAGEYTYANNVKDFFIDIIDNKQKVLFLAAAPHPDIAAMMSAVSQSENFEAESYLINDFNKNLSEYSLIVLHQLPSTTNNAGKVIEEIQSKNLSVLYIWGSQTVTSFFKNAFPASVEGKNKTNDCLPLLNPDFSFFTVSEKLATTLKKFPPLVCPYGTYRSNPASSFLFQKIGSVNTSDPLFTFSINDAQRLGVITGEGLWKWKLYDYQLNGNNEAFTELVGKMVQFLSVKEDKSKFRIVSKNRYQENETVTFDAEVYNESFELINTPEVTMRIIDVEGKEFPYTFSKTANAYRLNAGTLAPGEYRYVAAVKVGEKVFDEKGQFMVAEVQLEEFFTVADHTTLFNLSKKTGGKLFQKDDFAVIFEDLKSREDIRPVSHSKNNLKDLINFKFLFFLLLALLSLEWFLRKRNGIS